jgi:hypothetical protein
MVLAAREVDLLVLLLSPRHISLENFQTVNYHDDVPAVLLKLLTAPYAYGVLRFLNITLIRPTKECCTKECCMHALKVAGSIGRTWAGKIKEHPQKSGACESLATVDKCIVDIRIFFLIV